MKTTDDALYATIRDYLQVHLEKLRNLSEHTVRSYANALTGFVEYVSRRRGIPLRSVVFADFSKRFVCDFLGHLENERKCSVATRNLRLNAIRGFLAYAASCDVGAVANRNEVATIPFKKPKQSGIVQHMSPKAVSAIFAAVDRKSPKGFRDLCMLAMLYDTGARVQELLNIRLADVDLGKSPAVMLRGKGRKTRVVPMSARMSALLREYTSRFHGGKPRDCGDWLFFTVRNGSPGRMTADNVRHLTRRYGAMARKSCAEVPKNVHPHLFRHSRAMHLYERGMDLMLVSQWLGHAQFKTTLVYARADPEMKRKAIERAMAKEAQLKDLIKPKRMKVDDDDLLKRLYGLK